MVTCNECDDERWVMELTHDFRCAVWENQDCNCDGLPTYYTCPACCPTGGI